jgi:hypothetical protein
MGVGATHPDIYCEPNSIKSDDFLFSNRLLNLRTLKHFARVDLWHLSEELETKTYLQPQVR